MSTVPGAALDAGLTLVAKALAHPHRLELLALAAQGALPVEALAERCGLSVANASQHLQQLRRAGLVSPQRDGRFVRYGLVDDAVVELVAAVQRVAERHRGPRSDGRIGPNPTGPAHGL